MHFWVALSHGDKLRQLGLLNRIVNHSDFKIFVDYDTNLIPSRWLRWLLRFWCNFNLFPIKVNLKVIWSRYKLIWRSGLITSPKLTWGCLKNQRLKLSFMKSDLNIVQLWQGGMAKWNSDQFWIQRFWVQIQAILVLRDPPLRDCRIDTITLSNKKPCLDLIVYNFRLWCRNTLCGMLMETI